MSNVRETKSNSGGMNARNSPRSKARDIACDDRSQRGRMGMQNADRGGRRMHRRGMEHEAASRPSPPAPRDLESA